MSVVNPSSSSTSGGGPSTGGAGSSSGGGTGGGPSGSGGSGGGGGGPCGACKFLRRKCVVGCIFAPYFDQEQGAAYFAAVHKVFGASNVSKLLLHIPPNKRPDAVVTICYEAQSRLRDPVYGCVSHIFALQQQVANLQAELSCLQAHLAAMEVPTPPPPPQPPAQAPSLMIPNALSISDLPTSTPLPPAYDLSSVLFHPQQQWTTTMQQQQPPPHQFSATRVPPQMPPPESSGGGDLQELARELLRRHASPTVPCTQGLPPHPSK